MEEQQTTRKDEEEEEEEQFVTGIVAKINSGITLLNLSVTCHTLKLSDFLKKKVPLNVKTRKSEMKEPRQLQKH